MLLAWVGATEAPSWVGLASAAGRVPALVRHGIGTTNRNSGKGAITETMWVQLLPAVLPDYECKGCSRNHPWGDTFFFQTPPPPGHTWSQSPLTLRTPRPTMDQMRLDPWDKLTPPPVGHVNKHPPPIGVQPDFGSNFNMWVKIVLFLKRKNYLALIHKGKKLVHVYKEKTGWWWWWW